MSRRALVLALGLVAAGAQGAEWRDLWLRPDQQTLADRRRGYAQLESQEFAAAAQSLRPFHDPESEYNRGNALARTGDLKAALSAYDAALKGAPPDSPLQRDAKHNRELVARQLQKNSPQSQQDSSRSAQPPPSSQSSSQPSAPSQPSSQSQSSSQPQSSAQSQRSAQAPQPGHMPQAPANAPSERSGDGQKQAQANPPPAARRSADAAQSAAEQQAARDAQHPVSEQAQSLDQWLRWIPDDPGGLLRRKFMIEHLLQQREAAP